MSETANTHSMALASVKEWLDEDAEGRVMTLVEDPSFAEYVRELVEQYEALREALRWYADPDRYVQDSFGHSPVSIDLGDVARDALAAVPNPATAPGTWMYRGVVQPPNPATRPGTEAK